MFWWWYKYFIYSTEKGIRCKSGTVPATVILVMFLIITYSHCLIILNGKAFKNRDKSGDLPAQFAHILDSREKESK